MKMNKLCSNLDQSNPSTGGFTDVEKQTMRNNIGAAAASDVTNKSEIKVYEGSSTVHKNLMTIYEDSTSGAMAGVNFNNANSKVTMVKKPVAGDGGKVLTVTEPGGSVAPYYEWKEAEDGIDFYQGKLAILNNTYRLDTFIIDGDGSHKEFFGTVGLTTSSSGEFSICPLDADGNLIYGEQCINVTALPTVQQNFIPFMFKAANAGEIRSIAIKGRSSTSQATVTHLLVTQKV